MRFGSRSLSDQEEEEEGGKHMMDQPPTKNNRTFEQHTAERIQNIQASDPRRWLFFFLLIADFQNARAAKN